MKRAPSPSPNELSADKWLITGELEPLSIPLPIPFDNLTYSYEHESDSDSGNDEEEDLETKMKHIMISTEASNEEKELDDDIDEEEDVHMVDLEELFEHMIFKLSYHYLFIHRLHGYGTSRVLSAIDRKTKQRVAIKIVIKDGYSSDPIEIRVMSKLKDCMYCQQVLEYYRFECGYVIVSPLYKQDSIRKCIGRDIPKIKIFMKQLLTAVMCLHEKKIINRDLKLSNIMWDNEKMQLVLIDFDLSTFDSKKHARYAGTEGYESPEMLRIENGDTQTTYGNEIDIWTCGVILGMLILGTSESEITTKLVKNWIKRQKKRAIKELHNDLLLKMLTYKQDKRPTAKVLLKHSFFQ